MEKRSDDLEREFYLRVAKRYGCSKRPLANYTSDTLKGLAARGMLYWHGRSANDPSQYYTVQ